MFRKFRGNRVVPASQETREGNVDFRTTIQKDTEENGTGVESTTIQSKFLFQEGEHPSTSVDKAVNFHDIVDESERLLEHRISHTFLVWLMDSMPFRMVILLAILLNSLSIGLQTDKFLEDHYGGVFLLLDKVFLMVFVMEILVKWYHDFVGFWSVSWNVFDFVIVTSSLLGPSLTFLSGSRILRILKVLKALRSLRSISALRGLQIVVHTIIHSVPDMANIVALLVIFMFIFAILGDSFFGENCPQYFGSLGTTMFSLFICVTQDGWMGVLEELKGCGYYVLGALYLLVFITIGAFIFANLVVAVLVTNLEWAIAEQKEMEERQRHSKPQQAESATIVTVDGTDILHKLARHQQPLEIPEFNLHTTTLENYFLVLSAIEDNLTEFKKIQNELAETCQKVRALSSIEDVSDDDIFELSGMVGGVSHTPLNEMPPPPPPEPRQRRFNSLAGGDALSNLIAMSRNHQIDTARAHNLQHLLSQVHTHPSSLSLHHAPSRASFFSTARSSARGV